MPSTTKHFFSRHLVIILSQLAESMTGTLGPVPLYINSNTTRQCEPDQAGFIVLNAYRPYLKWVISLLFCSASDAGDDDDDDASDSDKMMRI